MFVFILFLCIVKGNWFTDKLTNLAVSAAGFDAGDTCGFTRDDALKCIKKYVDYNHDNKIDCSEFIRAKTLFMPTAMKLALRVAAKFGWDVKFEQVMYGCDTNHDCEFTEDDWIKGAKMCLPFRADLCKLKTACEIAATTTMEFGEEDWKSAKDECSYFTPQKCHSLENKWIADDALAAYHKELEKHKAHVK